MDRASERMALGALVLVGAALGFGPVIDNDLGFHLATGHWILEHHAFPQHDPCSQGGDARVYLAYAWGFDVLSWLLHAALGLRGIVLFRVVLGAAIGAALWRLSRARSADRAVAFGVALITLLALKPCINERPWLFTILLTIVTLDALVRFREGGSTPWWLAALFALWANLHVQFVYGLAFIGVALLDAIIARARLRESALLLAACTLATLVHPYGIRLWVVIAGLARQTSVFHEIDELRPPTFTDPEDFVLLAMLLIGGALAIRGKRRFELATILLALALGARAQRDTWLWGVTALPVLAAVPLRFDARWLSRLAAPIFALALIAVTLRIRASTEARLQQELANSLPVKAADAIEAQQLPGPLYNDFNWGGFLIWYLPRLPVAMDGRTNLYSDDELAKHFATWRGLARGSESDPALLRARTVLAPRDTPLDPILRADPSWRLVYSDALADVFTR